MELEDIAAITKINPAYLQFIEEDRFSELPAPVLSERSRSGCRLRSSSPMTSSKERRLRPRVRQTLWRGARRRCPHCGCGPVFVRWVRMHDRCSACGLQFLRNQGDTWLYWVLMDRIPIAIGLILVIFFGFSVASWQTGVLFFGGMAVSLVATMPQRQGVAVALNYLSRVYFRDPSDEIPGDM